MAKIRNKLNQRLIINLIGGKNIDLLAKGTANISEKEIFSPHLHTLIDKGDIVVMPTSQVEEMGARIWKDTEAYGKLPEQLKEVETESIREISIDKKQPQKRKFKK